MVSFNVIPLEVAATIASPTFKAWLLLNFLKYSPALSAIATSTSIGVISSKRVFTASSSFRQTLHIFSLKISSLFLNLFFSTSVNCLLYFFNFFSNVTSYRIYFGFMQHQMLSINLSIETFLTLPVFKFFSASSILNRKF